MCVCVSETLNNTVSLCRFSDEDQCLSLKIFSHRSLVLFILIFLVELVPVAIATVNALY